MRLLVADIVQGDVACFRFLVDQHGMALRKSAALGVLAGKPHRIALVDKRRESKRLAHCPVDALACLDHLAPIVEEAPNGAMDVESVGNRSEATTDFGEARAVDA